MPEYLDYIIVAFFAAFLGLKFVQTRATGHLWFLLPLLLVLGLNQGWANHWGEGFFVCYRLATVGSCFLAFFMYWRDFRRREADAIAANSKKRKARDAEQKRQKDAQKKGQKEDQSGAQKEQPKKNQKSGQKKNGKKK